MVPQNYPLPPALTVVTAPVPGAVDRKVDHSDDEILAAIRRGDDKVAPDFYWRVKPIVDRTVRRLLGRLDSDGEDLVQVVLVQLIEALPGYRGECPLDAWVSAVSANVVYKHIRRRRLERRILLSSLDDVGDVAETLQTNGPTSTIDLREALKKVADHLMAISADRAWAFVLHDVCGYSLEELSHICGISAAAAQSRLVRGRRELHGRIEKDAGLAEILERAVW